MLAQREVLQVRNLEFPLDRYYHKKYQTWVKVEGSTARVGFSSLLLESAGLLNYLNIKAERAKKGEPVGSFESAKFVSRIFAPVSGKISVNEDVISNPRLVNDNPYENWIFEIKIENPEELNSKELLNTASEIKEWAEAELKALEEE